MKKTVRAVWAVALTAVSLAFAPEVSGQRIPFAEDYEHVGEIDLESGQTLRGRIRFSLRDESVQIKTGGRRRLYNSSTVAAFQFVDAKIGVTRTFFSLPVLNDEGYAVPRFFELLHEDERLTLLTRQRREFRSVPVTDAFGNVRYFREEVVVERYYLMNAQGKLRECEPERREVLEFMDDHAEDVESFIRANRLKVERRADMIRVVQYYNSL